MSKLTDEQIQSTHDCAPEDATHYHSTTYLKYTEGGWFRWNHLCKWVSAEDSMLGWAQSLAGYHGSLDDLREILELRQEVERLKSAILKIGSANTEGGVENALTYAETLCQPPKE